MVVDDNDGYQTRSLTVLTAGTGDHLTNNKLDEKGYRINLKSGTMVVSRIHDVQN